MIAVSNAVGVYNSINSHFFQLLGGDQVDTTEQKRSASLWITHTDDSVEIVTFDEATIEYDLTVSGILTVRWVSEDDCGFVTKENVARVDLGPRSLMDRLTEKSGNQ